MNLFSRNFEKHGNSTWSPSALVILTILTAWMPCPQLTQAFGKASNLSSKLFGILAIETYQGIMRALVINGSSLLLVIWHRIHHLMETVSPTHFRIKGNVRFLKKLAVVKRYEDLVFFWPTHIAKKNQPPLILRLIQITTHEGTMYLVTNILDEKEFSNQAICKLYASDGELNCNSGLPSQYLV